MRNLFSLALFLFLAAACNGSPFEPAGPGTPPAITAVQPATARVGDPITISGTGFTASGNSLRIGAGYINEIASTDGTTLRLSLPSYLSACPPGQQVCTALVMLLEPGAYKVSVINKLGTSNQLVLTVVEP